MNDNHNVSVIITCFNQGRFAERAITSVVEQSYPTNNMEIVIVDDGSTDDSVEQIKTCVDQFKENIDIKLIAQDNRKTAGARNTGIRNAKYDVFAFLDIDDLYLPDKIACSVEEMFRYRGVGLVYSDYIEVVHDKEGKIVNRKRAFKPPFNRVHLHANCIVSTNSVFHREFFNRIGEFDESIKYAEDYDAYLRLAEVCMFRHIQEPLFIYNQHGANKMSEIDITDPNCPNRQVFLEEERKFKHRLFSKGQYFVSNS